MKVSYPFVADSIPEESEHKSCLRVAANQAALKILQRYKESAAACDRLKRSTLPELPAVIDESRDIPVGYLLQTDPMREVAFYCREQGHSEPEFKASVVAQGKKGKKNLLEYTCTVTTRDGDKLTTVASSLDRSKPMPISAARMLKILRPQLRSERLYTTKIELLEKVPDTGFEFEAIEHQPLPKEERGGGHKVMSTRVVRFESTEFTEESIGDTSRHGADKVNGLALERLRHARRRAIQKKFREQRRKKRNQNSS